MYHYIYENIYIISIKINLEMWDVVFEGICIINLNLFFFWFESYLVVPTNSTVDNLLCGRNLTSLIEFEVIYSYVFVNR